MLGARAGEGETYHHLGGVCSAPQTGVLGDVVRELRLAIWLRKTYGRSRTAFYLGTDSSSGDRHLGESVPRTASGWQ